MNEQAEWGRSLLIIYVIMTNYMVTLQIALEYEFIQSKVYGRRVFPVEIE